VNRFLKILRPIKCIWQIHCLCFLCLSCGEKKVAWTYHEITTSYPNYLSKKISLHPEHGLSSLELEFVRTASGTRLYLKISSLTFPHNKHDEKRTRVCISFGPHLYEFDALRLKGGQCLLLPFEAQLVIVSVLEKNQMLTISAGRYKSTMTFVNFSSTYRKLIAD